MSRDGVAPRPNWSGRSFPNYSNYRKSTAQNEKWKSVHFQKIAEAIRQIVGSRPTTALVDGGNHCQTIGRGLAPEAGKEEKRQKATRPLSPALPESYGFAARARGFVCQTEH